MSASIAFAVGNALQELDSAVEWFVYRREGDTMDAIETRCVLLNVVARPGIMAQEGSLDDRHLRTCDSIDRLALSIVAGTYASGASDASGASGPLPDLDVGEDEDETQPRDNQVSSSKLMYHARLAAAIAFRVHDESAREQIDGADASATQTRCRSQEPNSAATTASSAIDGSNESNFKDESSAGAGDRENWILMEQEFEGTCQRVLRSMQLVGAAGGRSEDTTGGLGGGSRVRAPLPPMWMRPWLNAIGILSLVWVWAGFVGMMMGLYLLSAEVWADNGNSEWSILILGGIGLVMLVLGTVAFI